MLAPRLLLCAAAAAAAGPAMAQGGQGAMMGPMLDYQRDPNASINQPPGLETRLCLDEKAHDGPPPKVISTMPAPGSTVRPGAIVLSVTFDQPMACKANTAASPFPIPCPGSGGAVLVSPDRRTLTTVCEVEAGANYSMPLVDFIGAGGAKSERYDLAFTTSAGAPVKDPRQAQALEKVGSVRR